MKPYQTIINGTNISLDEDQMRVISNYYKEQLLVQYIQENYSGYDKDTVEKIATETRNLVQSTDMEEQEALEQILQKFGGTEYGTNKT